MGSQPMEIWSYVRKYTYSSPERHIELLVNLAKTHLPNKTRVLDVGGGLMSRKEQLGKLGKVTTVDIKKSSWVDVVANAEEMPFKDKSFGVAALFMVLEHLKNPLMALQEANRVLKVNGVLLLTTVQYWHTHGHPKDYYRYTKPGLLYLLKKAGFRKIKIWSMGGPFLVIFHAIELNLPEFFRKIFLLTAPFFNFLDKLVFDHEDKRKEYDSVGWAVLAKK